MLVAGLVRLQLNSFLYVLDRRTILFLLGMRPGAVHVSNVTLGIEFDGAIEVGDSPIPLLFSVFGVAAPSPAATADLNFSQNADKSDCAKAFGKNNRSKIPANQVCTRITRINANEFRFDKAFFALRGIICGEAFEKQDAVRSWVGDN